MYMSLVRLFFCILIVSLFINPLAAQAGAQISLTSDSSISGHSTRLSFPAPYGYLRVTDVNSIVSRMKVTDSKGRSIFFDGKPYIGQSISIPPGDYVIACWSNFGNEIPQSVTIFLTDGNEPIQLVQSCNSAPVYAAFPAYPYLSGCGRYPAAYRPQGSNGCSPYYGSPWGGQWGNPYGNPPYGSPYWGNPYYGSPCWGNPYGNPCGNPFGIIYGYPCGVPYNSSYSVNCFGITVNATVTIP
jgi:hypothetical protein